MSRVSSKSSLSPSATSGSSAIDLGKDSGVNMGEKSQTSVSTGGIGVTREVANIGGVSVTGGVSVDVSPIRLDISGNPDYEDPSKSSISIGAGAEVPGGVLGVSGGVTINTNTGQVKGGSIGGEVVGIGINISKSSEGVGVGISLQIPFTPISFELGFEFPDKKEPTPTPTPIPIPTPTNNKMPSDWQPSIPSSPNSSVQPGLYYVQTTTISADGRYWYDEGDGTRNYQIVPPQTGKLKPPFVSPSTEPSICVNVTQANIDKMIAYPGGVVFGSAGSDWAYLNANKITQIQIFSEAKYLSPFGLVSLIRETYYRRCVTIANPFVRSVVPGIYFVKTIYAPNIYDYPNGAEGYTWQFDNYELISRTEVKLVKCREALPPPIPNSPPNPPPRKEMDECCRDSIKLLREIHKRLGVKKFPGELPSTIIQEVEKGQPATEPVQEKIEDFADLLMWMFQRDDERWGQWQIQIDVKDTDLTKEGDQGKQIKFPNLAESIAEMEGQLLSLQANVAALVALSTRNLCESGMGRQEAIKAYLASMAIAKYMNFPYDESDIEMPSTFTPKAESIDELIKESIIHVKGIEYTNKETQRDILLDLLQAAAITRAVHWRQVDPKKDIKSQILESIKGSADLSDKLENPLAKEDDPSKPKHSKDWEDFLDQVEDGFGFETGIEDAQTPYGRSRERRPRIRQIGDNIGQAGKPNG